MARTPWSEAAAVVEPERTWSPQQQAIFEWFAVAQGNLVVRARAGTGKTTTILASLRHIPGSPRILLAAFNKRIQTELASKLGDERAQAKTLHALGLGAVTTAWGTVKIDNAVEDERILAVTGAIPTGALIPIRKLVSLGKGMRPFSAINVYVDLAVAFGCEVDSEELAQSWPTTRIAEVAHAAVQLAKTPDPEGRISFDDMLYIPVACGLVRRVYQWVIVDEAQDMNVTQLLLAQKSVREGGHVVVVGDDRQAIYGFRGADSGSIDRLKKELGADELGLTTTYRCPKAVVAVARTLVQDFEAAEEAPPGYVATMPASMLPSWVGAGDVILSRLNAPLVPLCLGYVRAGKSARIEGKDVGKALAAVVKAVKGRTVPEFLARLGRWRDKQVARVKAYGKMVKARTQVVEDQVETLAALAEGCESVAQVVGRCESMFADTLVGSTTTATIVLSSIHKAKGLEWRKVFVLDWTLRTGKEEDNICYVAYTRAQETLVLVQGA